MKKYKLEKLVPGSFIDNSLVGRVIAPVAEKVIQKDDVKIVHKGQYMIIPKGTPAVIYRKFEDKFGRDKSYTLAYYEWKPMIKN